ncbi:MAG: hypothetical protein ACRDJP_09920 [Actinomycetota bacterium]
MKGFPRTRDAYAGLGAWIDAFDYGPAYQNDGDPVVTPADVELLADHGVRTLFIQAARLDPRSPGMLVDEPLLGAFLEEAHRRDIRVVGWYLPKLGDVGDDLAHLRAIAEFESEDGGHRFDGVAVDIEWTEDVPDHVERNRRLVALSEGLDAAVGEDAVGAIVLPAVQLEVVNTTLWPEFPYRELADFYDVWLPMAYWTFRSEESGYRDAAAYTTESVRRLRANLGDPNVPVHPIGGIGDRATEPDYAAFLGALDEVDAMGGSVYDLRTMSLGGWRALEHAFEFRVPER